jgi:hypothetical protein
MSDNKVGTLVEEALKRKERLQNLKRKNDETIQEKGDAAQLPA